MIKKIATKDQPYKVCNIKSFWKKLWLKGMCKVTYDFN